MHLNLFEAKGWLLVEISLNHTDIGSVHTGSRRQLFLRKIELIALCADFPAKFYFKPLVS